MITHTPGPWVCYADLPSTEPNWHIVTNASKMRVLANVHIEPGNSTDEANARLITASPELLAALKSLCDADASYHDNEIRITCADHGDAIKRMRIARGAIAKAEGRS